MLLKYFCCNSGKDTPPLSICIVLGLCSMNSSLDCLLFILVIKMNSSKMCWTALSVSHHIWTCQKKSKLFSQRCCRKNLRNVFKLRRKFWVIHGLVTATDKQFSPDNWNRLSQLRCSPTTSMTQISKGVRKLFWRTSRTKLSWPNRKCITTPISITSPTKSVPSEGKCNLNEWAISTNSKLKPKTMCISVFLVKVQAKGKLPNCIRRQTKAQMQTLCECSVFGALKIWGEKMKGTQYMEHTQWAVLTKVCSAKAVTFTYPKLVFHPHPQFTGTKLQIIDTLRMSAVKVWTAETVFHFRSRNSLWTFRRRNMKLFSKRDTLWMLKKCTFRLIRRNTFPKRRKWTLWTSKRDTFSTSKTDTRWISQRGTLWAAKVCRLLPKGRSCHTTAGTIWQNSRRKGRVRK